MAARDVFEDTRTGHGRSQTSGPGLVYEIYPSAFNNVNGDLSRVFYRVECRREHPNNTLQARLLLVVPGSIRGDVPVVRRVELSALSRCVTSTGTTGYQPQREYQSIASNR
jgi:hypothetical protein